MLDEELTRKLLGVMQQASPYAIKMTVNGNMFCLMASNGQRAEIPSALFYRMDIPDILGLVGVKADDTNKKQWG